MTLVEATGTTTVSLDTSSYSYVFHGNGLVKMSDAGRDILSMWPSFFHSGPHLRKLSEALGMMFENLKTDVLDVRDQLHHQTATWGLQYWEEYFGLPVQVNSTDYEARRSIVAAHIISLDDESEAAFVAGIEEITGITPTVVLADPNQTPYSMDIEIGIPLYEDAPTTAPTATVGSSGNVPAGTYTYKITYVFSSGETLPSPASTAEVLGVDSQVLLTNIPTSPSNATARRIYRKETGDADWTYVGVLSGNDATTFLDDTASGTTDVPAEPTAVTSEADQVSRYVAATKPAHITATLASSSFRLDVSELDVDTI